MEADCPSPDDPSGDIALHLELRARTADAHARLDAGFGGFDDARDYDAYLAGMAGFIDAAIAVIGAEGWLLAARDALARDRGLPAPGPAPVAAERDPARVAGWRYVVAGATLGARVLLRQARAADAVARRGNTAFLETFAGADAWPRCLALLRASRFDAAARRRACDAALHAFHAAEAALRQARSPAHAA